MNEEERKITNNIYAFESLSYCILLLILSDRQSLLNTWKVDNPRGVDINALPQVEATFPVIDFILLFSSIVTDFVIKLLFLQDSFLCINF